MSPALLEPASLILLAAGVGAVLRFVWLDSTRFHEVGVTASAAPRVTAETARRLAFQAEAARAAEAIENLPRAA